MVDPKPHISATQLEMYWKCPEQYRRRYIEKEIIPPGIALLQGKAIHQGAEVNFSQKIETHNDLPKQEIVDAAAAAFDTERAGGCELSDDEAARGVMVVLAEAKDQVVALADLHAEEQAPDYQPVVCEHKFLIQFPSATHDLLGFIDLVDDKDRVTDIKTAGKKPGQDVADSSTQLTIYAASFQLENGRPPEEVRLDCLTKTKTPKRHVIRSQRTPADFAVLINRVNATLDAIHKGVFTPASPGSWWCSGKWCGYARTCPFFNSERKPDVNGK